MLKITKEQFLFILLLYQFILINTEDIEDLKLAIASQIESLNSNSNIQNLLKDGGIFNCDSTYCSQISLISGQSKKNQIQKFPQINFINDDSNQYIITKIFLKHNFPLDSTNYKSGIKGISDIIYTKFYSYEENEISLTSINHSTFANNLLVYLPLYISDSLKNKILSISGQNPDSGYEDWINYDIFDPKSKIYTDICYPLTFSFSAENNINDKDSFKNFDITLEQRKKHFFPGNLQLCPEGCTYNGIEKDTISSVCECNEEYFYNLQGEYNSDEHEEYISFNFNDKDFYNSGKDVYFSMNYSYRLFFYFNFYRKRTFN